MIWWYSDNCFCLCQWRPTNVIPSPADRQTDIMRTKEGEGYCTDLNLGTKHEKCGNCSEKGEGEERVEDRQPDSLEGLSTGITTLNSAFSRLLLCTFFGHCPCSRCFLPSGPDYSSTSITCPFPLPPDTTSLPLPLPPFIHLIIHFVLFLPINFLCLPLPPPPIVFCPRDHVPCRGHLSRGLVSPSPVGVSSLAKVRKRTHRCLLSFSCSSPINYCLCCHSQDGHNNLCGPVNLSQTLTTF